MTHATCRLPHATRPSPAQGYGVLEERTAAVLRGAADMLGCRLNLTLSSFAADCMRRPAPEGAPGACTFPPTVNHAVGWAEAQRAAQRLVDVEDMVEVPPTMGGEDFAYFLEHVPGAMLFLGIGNASQHTDVNLRGRWFGSGACPW